MKATGGARVGWTHASWPLATLTASEKDLSLRVTLVGNYPFRPEEVVRLEPYGSIPLFSWGIRIVHTKADLPEKIIFACLGSRDRLLEDIRRAGFRPTGSPKDIPCHHGMPWRWSFVIAAAILWNVMFLADGFSWGKRNPIGPWSMGAIALLFFTSIALRYSSALQTLALKPGRSVREIQSTVRLITMASGFMLLILGFQTNAWAQHNQHDKHTADNVLVVSPTLVTSGQPTAAALATLRQRGFDAVIYVAPASVPDAVKDEQLIVTRQGLTFVNIPFSFEAPTDADFDTFTAVLKALGDRKVLVHCQVNMRASLLVFLHRVVTLREDPRKAWDMQASVWIPGDGAWRKLMERQLKKHGIAFEPL